MRHVSCWFAKVAMVAETTVNPVANAANAVAGQLEFEADSSTVAGMVGSSLSSLVSTS